MIQTMDKRHITNYKRGLQSVIALVLGVDLPIVSGGFLY
jgi:hypothetical protein